MSTCCAGRGDRPDDTPLGWFSQMIDHCYDYAVSAKDAGRPIVGIMCEYAPRELIIAAGAVPVCLCGGSADTIAAAETVLPQNLCPLIKSTFGYHIERSNPFLEMADLIVAETTCDGKKKMFELMAQSRPVHLMALPHRSGDPEAFAYWLSELHRLKAQLEQRFGVTITDQRLRDAIQVMNRERALRRELAQLMKVPAPPLTGRDLLEFKSSISGICADLAQYERAIELYRDACPLPHGADRVRVLFTGVPVVHGVERVVELAEQSGGLIVCMENCTGVKPILEDVDGQTGDLMEALAAKYFGLHCSVMTPNLRRMDYIRALAREYNADCVIELVWQACLTYDVETALVKQVVEQELGLPYLRIETDYSPSDSARIAVRIEALYETAQARKRARQ